MSNAKQGLPSDQNIWQILLYDPVDKRVVQYPKIRTTPHFLLLPTLNILQNPTISYNQVHPQQASFLQSSTLCVPTGYYQATPWYNTKLIVVTLPTLQFLWMRCWPLKENVDNVRVCVNCVHDHVWWSLSCWSPTPIWYNTIFLICTNHVWATVVSMERMFCSKHHIMPTTKCKTITIKRRVQTGHIPYMWSLPVRIQPHPNQMHFLHSGNTHILHTNALWKCTNENIGQGLIQDSEQLNTGYRVFHSSARTC